MEFKLAYADGNYVDNANGHLSSKGLYTTDANGEIRITGIVGTIVATETKSVEGFAIDPATQTQTVVVNPDDTQTLVFYNAPIGGVEIIKVNADDKSERIPAPPSRFAKLNTTRISNFFAEIRVVSYAENLDLLGFSVFYISMRFL